MSWAPKYGIESPPFEDVPRLLTREEIEQIVLSIPKVKSFDALASEISTNGLRDDLRRQLEDVELAPSMYEEFKATITSQYIRSRVSPGMMVGVRAAEALGESTTQMSLNTFHQAGSSKSVSTGINALKELIHARKERKNPATMIHYLDKNMTYNEVLETQMDLVEASIRDLVKDFDIASPEEFNQVDMEAGLGPWREKYSLLFRKPIPDSSRALRLYMDTEKMYKQKVTMGDVVNALDRAGKDQDTDILFAFASPMSIGVIDIYPKETSIPLSDIWKTWTDKGKKKATPVLTREDISEAFLFEIVPNLQKVMIKGTEGIKGLLPMTLKVWNLVTNERRIRREEIDFLRLERYHEVMEKIWILNINKRYLRTSGVPFERLTDLLLLINIAILHLDQERNFIVILMPNDTKPSSYSKTQIESNQDIFNMSNLVYGETTGTNILDILARPEVDKRFTICNNIHTIAEVFGIEAARAYFIQDLSNCILNSGAYINIRHITLLADFLFSKGVFLGVTHTGISRQEPPAMDLATHQKGANVLSAAAVTGKVESALQISSRLIVGAKPIIGTNSFEVRIDETKRAEISQLISRELAFKESQRRVIEENRLKDVLSSLRSMRRTVCQVPLIAGPPLLLAEREQVPIVPMIKTPVLIVQPLISERPIERVSVPPEIPKVDATKAIEGLSKFF